MSTLTLKIANFTLSGTGNLSLPAGHVPSEGPQGP